MARLNTMELPDFEEIPDSVLDEMLTEGADVVVNEQRKTAHSMLGGRGYGTGLTERSLMVTSPRKNKNRREISISFEDERPNGESTKRNAEIAFINEYGTSRQAASPFIRTANEAAADPAAQRQEAIYDNWLSGQ